MNEDEMKMKVVALLQACQSGKVDEVKKLLAEGVIPHVSVNIQGNTLTALHLASGGGHAEVVTTLIAAGADKETRDGQGFTPLLVAANLGQSSAVEALLTAGADIEACEPEGGNSALHFGVMMGRGAVVHVLLRAGANTERLNADGATPMHLAAIAGDTSLVRMLVAAGARKDSLLQGRTPLQIAEAFGHRATAEVLR